MLLIDHRTRPSLLAVEEEVGGVPREPLRESLERGEGGEGDVAVVHHVPAALVVLVVCGVSRKHYVKRL